MKLGVEELAKRFDKTISRDYFHLTNGYLMLHN